MTRAADVTRRSPRRVFRDRREAGRVLANLLSAYRDRPDVIVLGLARGGVPVAWEVAAALHAPLDAFIVRKLGAPGHEEFAVGALASGGRVVVNDDVVRGLRITPQELRAIAEREGRELVRREAAYRGGRPPLDVTGKTVILVDDGLATGASMFAAVQALREAEPAHIVIAVPAAPESTCREFAGLVDDVVCATHAHPIFRGRGVVLGFPPGLRRGGSSAARHPDDRGLDQPTRGADAGRGGQQRGYRCPGRYSAARDVGAADR